jgi:hypothetical protein
MTAIDDAGDPQAPCLERMKNEFLVAQQRRRDRASHAAPRPDDAGDKPLVVGPADEGLIGVAAERP